MVNAPKYDKGRPCCPDAHPGVPLIVDEGDFLKGHGIGVCPCSKAKFSFSVLPDTVRNVRDCNGNTTQVKSKAFNVTPADPEQGEGG